jgi:uncharacterized membrane protein
MGGNGKRISARTVSMIAVLTAVTTVLTLLVRIPFAPTRGYITLADVGVYFAAFSFGPWVAFFAGGVGTGLADAISGYPQWMVFSFFIHGLQGLLAGLIARDRPFPFMIAGWLVGLVVMVAGYFSVGSVLYGIGPSLAEMPGNVGQNVAGALIGIPLVFAVRKAYPPIMSFGKVKAWEEVKD